MPDKKILNCKICGNQPNVEAGQVMSSLECGECCVRIVRLTGASCIDIWNKLNNVESHQLILGPLATNRDDLSDVLSEFMLNVKPSEMILNEDDIDKIIGLLKQKKRTITETGRLIEFLEDKP
ncbi:MAG: hypothetical protein GY836_20490, partial [Herbaspirillum sp.]|uniref:hypothetical protein n=1 Tax=Herbaspirillum sp. TaxID=1890675 RepID=UPI00258A8EF3